MCTGSPQPPSPPSYGAPMEAKLKHLEFIQAVIARLSTHSFLFKGWALTISTALLGLGAVRNEVALFEIALFATVLFWGLDGYYLWLERCFVDLYKLVAAKPDGDVDFSLDIDKSNAVTRWLGTCFWRPHLILFYLAILIINVIGIFLVRGN